jgi:hypothetical protein
MKKTVSPQNNLNSHRKSSLLFLFPLNIVDTTPYSLFVNCCSPPSSAYCPSPLNGGGKDDQCGDGWWAIYESSGSVKDVIGVGGCVSGNHGY